MVVKFGIRGLVVLLAGNFLACWSELSAQTRQPVANSVVSSSSPVSSLDSDSHPPEVASTKTTDLPVGKATSVSDKPTPKPMDEQSSNGQPDASYTVGIADELQISVWKEPDLSGPVVVRPDGMITLPVVDDVKVVGLTTKEVQAVLTDKLKNIVAEPQVTVIVRTIRSRKVYLVGQVGRPGAVMLNAPETVLQVLTEAGGLGPYAKADKIYILRMVGDHQEKLNFNYKKAVKGGDPSADFPLVKGDVIVVP